MFPGKRSFKISFWEPSLTLVNGAQKTTYPVEEFNLWAGYVLKGGRLFNALQKISLEISVIFETGYISSLDNVRAGWKVKKGTIEYNVIFVDDNNRLQNSMLVACKAVK